MNQRSDLEKTVILKTGEFYHRTCFGPDTINCGAVLIDCQWRGGCFKDGHMLGGFFDSGTVLGGFFSGVTMLNCNWHGGTWHGGYDVAGLYKPRFHSDSTCPWSENTIEYRSPDEHKSDDDTRARVLIASPHLYGDLARLWYRGVKRHLIPALEAQGLKVDVLIFCDNDLFPSEWFAGATLWQAGKQAMDFIHFYDVCLGQPYEYLFFMDADIFFIQSEPLIPYLQRRDDTDFAAISFLQDDALPGSIYALFAKREVYAQLPSPAFAARYDNAKKWPFNTHYDPGAYAAKILREQGAKIIVGQSPREFLVDFHGTTNLRITLEMLGRNTNSEVFHYIQNKNYFLQAAYDNILLAILYKAVTGDDFAAEGGPSFSLDILNSLLLKVVEEKDIKTLHKVFSLSNRAVLTLAEQENVEIKLPNIQLANI